MLNGFEYFILENLVKQGMTVQSLMYQEFEIQPFPFPPLSEQKRIVAKVEELLNLCNGLEEQLTRSRQKSERLMSAVVQGVVGN
jgi:type I restriction enzyme S subunit